ncbi:hypothetical protein K8R47_02190 [archaeon]|nr:hypothetical protein [archaeon]
MDYILKYINVVVLTTTPHIYIGILFILIIALGVRIMKKIDEEILEEDESIYNNKKREKLVEDDELSPEEEGFMMGWEES